MTQNDILTALATGKISQAEASKLLTTNNAASSKGTLSCKVSAKGALSVYGLQRMPVTLYIEQWDRLIAYMDELKTFAEAHRPEFSLKPAKE